MKKKIIFFLLVGVLLAGGGYVAQRTLEAPYHVVLRQYCKALQANDEEKVLSMIQAEYINYMAETEGEDIGEITNQFREEVKNGYEVMKEDCGKEFRASYSITDVTKYSSEELERFSDMLRLFDDRQIDSAYLIALQFNAKGKKGDYYGSICAVIVYRSGGKWYIRFRDGKMF